MNTFVVMVERFNFAAMLLQLGFAGLSSPMQRLKVLPKMLDYRQFVNDTAGAGQSPGDCHSSRSTARQDSKGNVCMCAAAHDLPLQELR